MCFFVSSSLHKVIMVGSGGVGKSALTLQVSMLKKQFSNLRISSPSGQEKRKRVAYF